MYFTVVQFLYTAANAAGFGHVRARALERKWHWNFHGYPNSQVKNSVELFSVLGSVLKIYLTVFVFDILLLNRI